MANPGLLLLENLIEGNHKILLLLNGFLLPLIFAEYSLPLPPLILAIAGSPTGLRLG